MSSFRAACRTGDNIASANGISGIPDSYFAVTLQHKKHFLLRWVIVKWPRTLSRRYGGDVIPKLLSADSRAYYSHLRLKTRGGGPSRRKRRRGWLE
jgi:hypothetical protein